METLNALKLQKIMSRLVEEADAKLKGEDVKMVDVFNNDEDAVSEFPIKRDAWYRYSAVANPVSFCKRPKDMSFKAFYNLCVYTNFSADYFLGFNKVKVKEASAGQVQEDFGISNEALMLLNDMTRHTIVPFPAKYKDFAESEFIDFLILRFSRRFLSSIVDYFYKLDELESFRAEYVDPQTGLLKADDLAEQYQELEEGVQYEEFILTNRILRFVGELRQELLTKESTEQ